MSKAIVVEREKDEPIEVHRRNVERLLHRYAQLERERDDQARTPGPDAGVARLALQRELDEMAGPVVEAKQRLAAREAVLKASRDAEKRAALDQEAKTLEIRAQAVHEMQQRLVIGMRHLLDSAQAVERQFGAVQGRTPYRAYVHESAIINGVDLIAAGLAAVEKVNAVELAALISTSLF